MSALVAAAIAVAFILSLTARRADAVSFAREEQLIFHALDQTAERMARDQEGIILRDGVVTWLLDPPTDEENLGLMDRNFGTFFHAYYGHDESYVLNRADVPIYAMTNGRRAEPGSFERVRAAAEPVIAELRGKTRRIAPGTLLTNGSPGAHDVSVVNGHPSIVSVKPIMSPTGKVVQEPGREIVQISVMYLDGRFVDNLRTRYLLSQARFAWQNNNRGNEAVRPFISRRTGEVIGYFIWQPYSPGAIVLRDMVPPLLAALLLVGAVVAVLFWRDVSRQRQAEREIARMQNELLHMSRLSAMGTMGSTLAHELNQPLASITNYVGGSLEMLKAGGTASLAKAETALRAAEASAVRAGQIVKRLRDLVSRGGVSAEKENLPELIEDACAVGFVDEHVQRVSHRLELDPQAQWVKADRVQVQQVLINLIRNAIQAMQDAPKREVIISTKLLPEKKVEICVADTGPGIQPDQVDQLFSPFETDKVEGLGLGLSICRTIVEAHGGRIRLVNGEEGARFCFTLKQWVEE
ncbi:MAG TPA: ATP-binding protein [Allosphingosinicella sp.]|uniref:ATP-binding protein n=1 Tax=Allosphingosinicella sp. TaxID=2823234 RepID=UPI002ED89C20